jgi:hypothetical protein
MDLKAIIESLRIEKQRVERVIAQLEQMCGEGLFESKPVPVRRRRGRKSMDPEERQQVAARMKSYWAKRRKTGNETTENQSDVGH